MSCLGCAGGGKSFFFSLDVISLKVAIAVQFNCLMLLNQEWISINLATLTWSPPAIAMKSAFSPPATSTKSASWPPPMCSICCTNEDLAWMEEGVDVEDEKSKVAAARRRRKQEMAAVVMVMEEGKDHGGGFALDERAPPCHIFPRTKMPLD